MKTPIKDFVKKYALNKSVRLHMPGHKGVNFLGLELFDLTEIDGADVLYNAKGVILESQNNATALFGTKKTLYSTEGSSLSIRAMVHLVKCFAQSRQQSAKILAFRNVHKSFVTATALANVDVKWLWGQQSGILTCKMDDVQLESEIVKEKPTALFVTSPDYLGNVQDVEKIAKICHKHDVLVLVDNAHGAYLKFTDVHPVQVGADLVCDSAHKTLPALTPSAYLHVGKTAPDFFVQNAENALSLYATTSPSYLILQSLDNVNKILFNNPNYFDWAKTKVANLKEKLTTAGFSLVGQESLKLTVATKSYGYLGEEVAQILKENNVFVEFSDKDYVTMMFSPCNDQSDFELVEKILCNLPRKTPINILAPTPKKLQLGMLPNQAIFESSEVVSVDDALNKILATPTVSCPPAIPIATCGEIINQEAVDCFKYYGTNKILVVKQ
ncbi:MAG: aminotransferase class V-fold PLP-dependent enzyme [Clostridia bacterium]|nr:aminotransferase class V-fold PLP-dependent enzyme [Clostridia bacterium]